MRDETSRGVKSGDDSQGFSAVQPQYHLQRHDLLALLLLCGLWRSHRWSAIEVLELRTRRIQSPTVPA